MKAWCICYTCSGSTVWYDLFVVTIYCSFRDIQDKTVGTLAQRISNQLLSLEGLRTHLEGVRDYLGLVAAGTLPKNHTILYQLQDIFNLLPNLNLQQFSKSFAIKFNDQLLVVYLASLIRAVVALHHLIQNKISNHEAEKQEGHKKEVTQYTRVCLSWLLY